MRTSRAILLAALLTAPLLAGCSDGPDAGPSTLQEPLWVPVVHVAGALVPAQPDPGAGGAGAGGDEGGEADAACPELFRYGFDPDTRTLRRWADPGLRVDEDDVAVLAFSVDLRDVGCENPYGLQVLGPDDAPSMVRPGLRVPLPLRVEADRIVVAGLPYPEGEAAAVPVDTDGLVGTLLLTHLGLWRMETVPERAPLDGDRPVWRTRTHPEAQAFHVVTLSGRVHQDPPDRAEVMCGRPLYTFQVDEARHEIRRLRGHHDDLDTARLALHDQAVLEPPSPCGTARLVAVAGDPLRLRVGELPADAPSLPIAAHPYLLRVDRVALPVHGTAEWAVRHDADDGRTYAGTLTLTYLGVWTRHDVRTVATEDEVFGEA